MRQAYPGRSTEPLRWSVTALRPVGPVDGPRARRAVRHALSPATPWVLGAAALVLGLGAVLTGAVLAGTTHLATATRLTLLRTTLGGLAVASLPALVTSAVRVGRARP